MKVNTPSEKGYVYVGDCMKAKRYAEIKFGQSAQDAKARERQIRETHPHFKMLLQIHMPNSTPAQRKHVESEVHAKMEKYATNIGNDYFRYRIRKGKKELQRQAFMLIALGYAIDCCVRENYPFTL